MAVIRYVEKHDLSEANQDLLARNFNSFRALANSPDCCRAFWGLGGFLQKVSRLDPRLRELAILQIGWKSQCRYEWAHHIKVALEHGVSETDIRSMMAETRGEATALDPPALAVLRAAREMYDGPGASPAVIKAIEAAIGTESLVDLIVAIGFYIGIVRLLVTLDIEMEPEYQPYLDRFPLMHA